MESGFDMPRGEENRVDARAWGGLVLTLLWSALALAQSGITENPSPTGIRPLPDAPSASIARPVTSPQPAPHRLAGAQSWYLVARREAPYRPLTREEKFQSFLHHAYSPYTFLGAAYDATWAQALSDPREYGGGMQGWGKRFGAAVAGTESRSFFGVFLFPALLHQDPRYFAQYRGAAARRAWHAVSQAFVARNDNGRYGFNTSGVLAIIFAESLGVAWVPEGQRSGGKLGLRMLGAVQSNATGNLLREFTPDILRAFKRMAPKSVRRIEEKMPPQITGDIAAR